MTFRYALAHISSNLSQQGDDSKITPEQILFWIQTVAAPLQKQHMVKHNTGLYLNTFTVNVKFDDTYSTTNPMKYIDVPVNIFDLNHERGVKFIRYNVDTGNCKDAPYSFQNFSRTTATEVANLYGDRDEEPSPTNPYFYREGDKRLNLPGIECIGVENVQLGVNKALDPTAACKLDDEIPIPDDLGVVLLKQVESFGIAGLIIPEERINDGADTTAPIQTQGGRR